MIKEYTHPQLTPIQLAHRTNVTRGLPVSMVNGKPYRTAKQKIVARNKARKCADGAWRSSAPCSFHK